MTKILWLDTETTGLYNWKNDIIQLGGIVEFNNKAIAECNIKMQPSDWNTVEDKALAVSGTTIDMLMEYPSASEGFRKFESFLNLHVDRFNRADKFIFAGYNTQFDHGFVKSLFKKHGNKFMNSYFEYKLLDVYQLVFMLALHYKWDLPNHKLVTMANFFNIPIVAHDALGDIRATRELFYLLKDKYLKEVV